MESQVAMKRTVQEHINNITAIILKLETDSKKATSEFERYQLEADIKQLRLALQHFDLALEIERNVVKHRTSRGLKTGT